MTRDTPRTEPMARTAPVEPGKPSGHGTGRPRGGLNAEIHAAVDGRRRPLTLVVTAGPPLTHAPRALGGDPDCRQAPGARAAQDAVLADKADSF